LLRYLSIADPPVRSALADIELDGHVIEAGDSITISVQAANRDPARFANPDVLDLHGQASGQLAVAPEEVPMRNNSHIYGVHKLPVAW
jgi:cytochrome P450